MAIIETKSLQELIDIQLTTWQALQPNVTTNTDSMVYLDASVIAEVAYLLQSDAITLTNNAFLAYATGDELTNLGIDRGIPRKSAVLATGFAKFGRNSVGTSNFTIDAGTIVSTAPSELDGTYTSFKTTVLATLGGLIASPLAPTISKTTNVSGRFTPDTYSFSISAFDANGETIPGTASTTVVATTSSISLSWATISGATKYGIYYAVGAGSFTKVGESTGTGFSIPDTGSLPGTAPMVTNGTGALSIVVPIVATEAGVSSNVAINTITNFVNKPIGIDYVINDSFETSGGTDEEDDATYRIRIKDTLTNNTGKVTVDGYKQTALSVPGVANAKVSSNGVGAYRNDILVVITSTTGTGIPSAGLITTVQDTLNSDENRAVCDNITVQAPATRSINVTVNVTEYDPNYTTTFLTTQIQDALNVFFPTVPIGGKVYVVEVANVIHDIEGIIDFTLTVPTANTTLSAGEMAIAGTINITI